MNNTKIKKSYTDYGFGFPVQLNDFPFIKIDSAWVLDINFEKYERVVLFALALKSARLSGNETKFIRHHFEMDLKSFGRRFGDVSHSAVIKWEKYGDNPTSMSWAIEKDIRLAIVKKLKPRMIRKIYEELECPLPKKLEKIKISTSDLKAA